MKKYLVFTLALLLHNRYNPTFAAMAKILNIETATTVCSISVGVDGEIVSVNEINNGYSHAEEIEGLIEKSLQDANLNLNDLDAISVSKGPGSYTGLRIGVSISKGLCFGLNIPLLSVPTLESLALHPNVLAHKDSLKIPMLDARRMEVYACVLNPKNEVITPTAAVIIDEDSFANALQKSTVLFGPGSEKCQSSLAKNVNAIFIENILPSAAQMVSISEGKFTQNQVEDLAYFEPFYLKDFVAGKPKKLL